MDPRDRLEAELATRSPVIPLDDGQGDFSVGLPDPEPPPPPTAQPPPQLPDYRLPGQLAHQLLSFLSQQPYGEVAWLFEEIGKIEQL